MDAYFSERLIYDKIKESGFSFAHCSNITQLNKEYLMAQWYTGKAEQSKNQSIYTAKYNIKDQKWDNPYLLSKSTEYPEGNGVLWKDSKKDRLFLFYATMWTHSPFKKMFGRGWFYCKLFYKISEDDGDTWSSIKSMKEELGFMYRNKPLRLSSGRILIPMYKEVPPRGLMGISDDNGENFRFSNVIENDQLYPNKGGLMGGSGNTQPTLAELDDGRLLALMRTRMLKKIFRSISNDGGETWQPAREINLPNPDSGIDLVRLKSGKLLLIFNNASRGRHNLSLALNKDIDGIEWQVVKVLEDNPKMKFSYPSIIQTSSGEIHATYTYNRKTIKHISFNEEWLNSKIEKFEN